MSEIYYEKSEKTRQKYLIPQFKNNLKPVLPPVYERFTKEELEDVIVENYGIVTVICALLDCTYKQLYQALDKFELRNKLLEAKQSIVSVAEEVILQSLASKNENIRLRSAEITLKSLGRNFGWGTDNTTVINQNISVGDKETKIKNIFGIQ